MSKLKIMSIGCSPGIYLAVFDENAAEPAILMQDDTPGSFYRQNVFLVIHWQFSTRVR